eukprot:CAMPEP_0184863634 /NCGR_PEP_ID=MMETSP0580-20130426/11985_1 /TAXON_ID=1118495 /ORGANISM="Dactyliosolen fragilissimus" /LENGTH=821 /DNA_ID=CAMNT_0027362083 /DNA_START=77 /DNA_END=2542 /DNA_ORIENTATION=-
MRIDTPQILWHNGSDGNGKAAPLYSVSLLPEKHRNVESKVRQVEELPEILATAGNTPDIHLWKVSFAPLDETERSKDNNNNNNHKIDNVNVKQSVGYANQCSSTNSTLIKRPAKKIKMDITSANNGNSKRLSVKHHLTLSRHERSVNAVAFSNGGHHLASAGDGGSLVIFSIQNNLANKGNGNGNGNNNGNNSTDNSNILVRKEWNNLRSEKDLNLKILPTQCEDISDLSWSPDDRRLILGSLDHSLLMFTLSKSSDGSYNWKQSWRNNKEHTRYVQGVAFDPLNAYIASQGNDRIVSVWPRKKDKASTNNSQNKQSRTNLNSTNATPKVDCKPATNSNHIHASNKQDSTDLKVSQNYSNNILQTKDTNASLSSACKGTNGSSRSSAANDKFELERAMVLKYRYIEHNKPNTNLNVNENQSKENKSNATNSSTETNKEKAVKTRFVNPENKNAIHDNKDTENISSSANTTTTNNNTNAKQEKHYMFADESAVESFFRRLAWSPDGAFLIAPAGLYHNDSGNNNTSGTTKSPPSQNTKDLVTGTHTTFATYLFARHKFEKPYMVLAGLDKPSVVVKPNPILFELPPTLNLPQKISHANDENDNPSSKSKTSPLPYRSIFAVLTLDTILIYDTFQAKPICIAKGLHYAGLTDCTWSSDGLKLFVTSTDGYISILSFGPNELGFPLKKNQPASAKINSPSKPPLPTSTLPPCEPGNLALVAPPKKKARKIAPTLISPPSKSDIPEASTNKTDISVNSNRKRITPSLVQNSVVLNSSTLETRRKTDGKENGKEDQVVGAVTNLSLHGKKVNQCSQESFNDNAIVA